MSHPLDALPPRADETPLCLDAFVRARWPAAAPLAETVAALLAAMPRPVDADLAELLVHAGWARAAREAGATHEDLCAAAEVLADRRAFFAAFAGSRAAPLGWEDPRAHLLRLMRGEPSTLPSLVFVLTTAALRRLHPEYDAFPPRRRDRNGRRIARTPHERRGDRLRAEATFALALLDGMGDPALARWLGPVLRGAEGRAAHAVP